MKRIGCVVASLGLLVAACGSGDDEPAANDSGDQSIGATADEPAAGGADDQQVDGFVAGPIGSIGDVPEVCRQAMAGFLREVEPIVSPIDWQTATVADFAEITEDFEALSDDFERTFDSSGCGDLDFVDDNEFGLMTEFARSEAPGTVGFLEFLDALTAGVASIGETGDDPADGSADGGSLETCDDGIAFVQGLMDRYDAFVEVPAAELLKFTQVAALFLTCTPEQRQFLESDEVTDFLGE